VMPCVMYDFEADGRRAHERAMTEYDVERLKGEVNELARLLCQCASFLESRDLLEAIPAETVEAVSFVPERVVQEKKLRSIREWWTQHKEHDAKRREEMRAKLERIKAEAERKLAELP